MFEERAGRAGLILAAIQKGGDGGNAARLTDFPKEGTALTSIIGESRAGGRVGPEGCRSILQQLGVEERQRVFERVRFRPGYGAFDSCCVQAVGYEPRNQKVNGIFQTAGVVAGVFKQKSRFAGLGVVYWLRIVANTQNDFVLSLQCLSYFGLKLSRLEEFSKPRRCRNNDLMALRDHTLGIVSTCRYEDVEKARTRNSSTA